MTHDFMTQRGLNNLVWCYMPIDNGEDKTPAADKFDMFGADDYQYQGDVDKYMQDVKDGIALMKEYSDKYNKPITLSETGAESLKVDNWFTEVLLPSIEGTPISYVLLWRNAWDKPEHFYCSYKGHSSEEDFRKFVESPSIITVKDIANLKR